MKSLYTKAVRLKVNRARKDDMADFFEGHKPSDYWVIDNLWVHKDYRRKGIATGLLQMTIAEARLAGKGIVAQAYPYEDRLGNGVSWGDEQKQLKKLLRFYAKFGLRHVGDGWMILEKHNVKAET